MWIQENDMHVIYAAAIFHIITAIGLSITILTCIKVLYLQAIDGIRNSKV